MAFLDHRRLLVSADAEELAQKAAERIMARFATLSGRIAVCLAGGSSPKQLYQLLAGESRRRRIPWDRVHWFIGDERFVPEGDPQSNMAMIRKVLLDGAAPRENIHPIPTDAASPAESALSYERELKSFYGAERLDPARPLFAIVLLGAGPDGHTASLFPGDAAVRETERWVAGVPKAEVAPFVPRVTLTLPPLCSCREMLFEVAGPSKRTVMARLLNGENLPAACARSVGETVWLVDRAALPEGFRDK